MAWVPCEACGDPFDDDACTDTTGLVCDACCAADDLDDAEDDADDYWDYLGDDS